MILKTSFLALAGVFAFTAMATEKLPDNSRGLKSINVNRDLSDHIAYKRKFAICIGIDKYPGGHDTGTEHDLTAAVSDAERMSSFFEKNNFCQVVLLRNEEATKDGIIGALEKVKATAEKDDLLIFYFAGHGIVANRTYHSYLIPFACSPEDSVNGNLDANGISLELLKEMTLTMNCIHVLLLLDCCYSGSVDTGRPQRPETMTEDEFKEFVANQCVYALFASGITQAAREKRWVGGVFTDSVLQGLNGQIDHNADANKDGKVFIRDELSTFVRNDVSRRTEGTQKPVGERLQKTDGDIVFDLGWSGAPRRSATVDVLEFSLTKDEIIANYKKVIELQQENAFREAGVLMTKTYLAYCDLPQSEQIILLHGEKDRPRARHAEFLEKLAELSRHQVSRFPEENSALASYYLEKCLRHNPSPMSESIAYRRLGIYNYVRGNYGNAEILLRKAVALLRRIDEEDNLKKRDEELLVCYRFLGMCALELYKYDEAWRFLVQQSRNLVEKYKDDDSEQALLERAGLYNDVGRYHIETGSFNDAKLWLDKSLNEYGKLDYENHVGIADTYHHLGVVADHNSEVFQALRYFKKALAINEEIFGEGSEKAINSLLGISAVYLKPDTLKESLKYALEAKNIAYRHYRPEHPLFVEIYSQLGLAYLIQSKYSPATYFLEKAAAVSRRRYGKHPKTAVCYKNLGLLYQKRRNWRKSIECLNKAREIQQEFLVSSHHVSIATAQALKETEGMRYGEEIKRKREQEEEKKEREKKEKSWLQKIF